MIKSHNIKGGRAMIDKTQDNRIQRRNFLKWGGASLLSLPFMTKTKIAFGASINAWRKNYWEGPEGSEYCVHRTVNTTQVDSGYIWARVDGWWRRFQIRELDDNYWNWNFDERMKRLVIQFEAEWDAVAGGPAQPFIATYGNRRGRGDSDLHLNNKVIYLSLAPKEEHIEEINNTMLENLNNGISFTDALPWWIEIHENEDLWCKDRQVGLEVFSNPGFETHNFLNLMENPVATMGHHAIYNNNISYEIRCINKIVHPRDPKLTDYERNLALHPSIQFAWAHSYADPEFIYSIPGVIYHHVEEYNNSRSAEPGIRVVKTVKQKLKRFFA